jgi:hypothetical protein
VIRARSAPPSPPTAPTGFSCRRSRRPSGRTRR